MKKKNHKKIIIAISSFLIASSCLAVSSYAWFSIGAQLAVDNYDFHMSSAGDISIGLKINSETLAEKYHKNIGDIYYPTDGVINDSLLKEFNQYNDDTRLFSATASYEDEWLLDDTIADDQKKPILRKVPTPFDINGKKIITEEEANKYYYQLELYVKANRPMYIYVDEQTLITPDKEKNKQEALLNSDKGVDENQLNKIVDSLRVSFYTSSNYFIYEPAPRIKDNEIIPTRMFGKLDLYNTDGYYDYNIQTNKEFLFGEYKNVDKIVYDMSGADKGNDLPTISNGLLANTKDGVMPVDIAKSIDNGIEGKYQETHSLKEISAKYDDEKRRFSLFTSGGEGEYDNNPAAQRVIVTIWSEGWDEDSISFPSSSHFNMNLVFGGKALR